MSETTRAALDARLETYERQTGHQVVVWIGASSGSLPLDEFATQTFKAWALGRKGFDDGLLMVVLATDHKIAIEVGYGLEDRVPDAIASRIINDVMAPQLRAGNADAALTSGVDAVLSAVEGTVATPTPATPANPHAAPRAPPHSGFQNIVLALLALGFIILLITNPSLAMYLLFVLGSGGRGGGGGDFGGGGFSGGGGRSGGGGARGSW